ncbi:MAG: gamma-glutamylcyclotransferase [Chloroflexi bacterium]|nr:gamma-glutamylcyclotransferase [Chloroflexota bacterium]
MYYFAYGSNLNKKQMKARCPDSVPVKVATLPNYKLVFVDWSRQWQGGVATVKGSKGDKVLGALYEVSESDLRKLDKYESGYSRLKVRVFDEDGNAVEAVTYTKTGLLQETQTSKDYLAIVQQGYRDWGLF